MRCLLVEDDAQLREYIAKGLRESGHTVDLADNGKDGLFLATTETYDALVLDWMLPGADGIKILHAIRASGNQVPALMLSARSDVDDRVKGLRSGADDYLVKPFAFDELLARLEVISQRRSHREEEVSRLECHDLTMELLSREVIRGGDSGLISIQESSPCWSIYCAIKAKSSPARCCSRTSGIITSTRKQTSSTCTSAGLGRRSINRLIVH